MLATALQRRARRAIERQLDYQRLKAQHVRGHEAEFIDGMTAHAAEVRAKLGAHRPIPADAAVLQVGSGAHGMIFCFEGGEKIGVDPLADEYRQLFPAWQPMAQTITAFGEDLPFEDGRFDIVLCDNVVDHAEGPRRIVEELVRVLKPGGLLYFTVNIHHPVYHWAASVHAAWRAVGVPLEITPFADHTFHLTLDSAKALFRGLPIRRLYDTDSIAVTKARRVPVRHPGDLLKKLFFKNAHYELIAVRD